MSATFTSLLLLSALGQVMPEVRLDDRSTFRARYLATVETALQEAALQEAVRRNVMGGAPGSGAFDALLQSNLVTQQGGGAGPFAEIDVSSLGLLLVNHWLRPDVAHTGRHLTSEVQARVKPVGDRCRAGSRADADALLVAASKGMESQLDADPATGQEARLARLAGAVDAAWKEADARHAQLSLRDSLSPALWTHYRRSLRMVNQDPVTWRLVGEYPARLDALYRDLEKTLTGAASDFDPDLAPNRKDIEASVASLMTTYIEETCKLAEARIAARIGWRGQAMLDDLSFTRPFLAHLLADYRTGLQRLGLEGLPRELFPAWLDPARAPLAKRLHADVPVDPSWSWGRKSRLERTGWPSDRQQLRGFTVGSAERCLTGSDRSRESDALQCAEVREALIGRPGPGVPPSPALGRRLAVAGGGDSWHVVIFDPMRVLGAVTPDEGTTLLARATVGHELGHVVWLEFIAPAAPGPEAADGKAGRFLGELDERVAGVIPGIKPDLALREELFADAFMAAVLVSSMGARSAAEVQATAQRVVKEASEATTASPPELAAQQEVRRRVLACTQGLVAAGGSQGAPVDLLRSKAPAPMDKAKKGPASASTSPAPVSGSR